VFVVTYGCHTDADGAPVASVEHRDLGLFTEAEVAALPMPDGYRRSIATWFDHLHRQPAAVAADAVRPAAPGTGTSGDGGRVGL
jgi:hypothetical protein